jgi:hypothetical protein
MARHRRRFSPTRVVLNILGAAIVWLSTIHANVLMWQARNVRRKK